MSRSILSIPLPYELSSIEPPFFLFIFLFILWLKWTSSLKCKNHPFKSYQKFDCPSIFHTWCLRLMLTVHVLPAFLFIHYLSLINGLTLCQTWYVFPSLIKIKQRACKQNYDCPGICHTWSAVTVMLLQHVERYRTTRQVSSPHFWLPLVFMIWS